MVGMPLKPWIFLDQKLVAETRIFRLIAERWRSPRTGVEHVFTNVDSVDYVNVVAIDTQGCLIMIRQFRFGTREFTLEVPGGMCEPGEDPSLTAVRELREETGYVGKSVVSLGFCEPNPAIFNNRAHMFLVEGCERSGELLLDPGEDIEVVPTPLEEVMELQNSGAITHALVSVALARFDLYRRGLLRLSASTRPNAAKLGTNP
ncbi:MAG: hydrolase [Myxococcaceae bacterium]|nr:hydrolase [Myxococcaceae bacterium]